MAIDFSRNFYRGDGIKLNGDIPAFYKKKSVLHLYNFYVDMSGLIFPLYSDVSEIPHQHSKPVNNGEGFAMGGTLPFLYPYNIIDVDIPSYKFKRSSLSYGTTQFSHPILDDEQPLDLKLTIEDDVRGTGGRLISWLHKTVVINGVHQKIPDMKLGNIVVYLVDEKKVAVSAWEFVGVFFLGCENLRLAYESNETVRYSVTFGCDRMVFYSNNYEYDDFPSVGRNIINNYKDIFNPKSWA